MSTPIFDQLRHERPLMDHPLPEMDAQSRAYREMPPEMIVADDAVRHFVVRHHDLVDDLGTLTSPDEYETARWDAGREDPR